MHCYFIQKAQRIERISRKNKRTPPLPPTNQKLQNKSESMEDRENKSQLFNTNLELLQIISFSCGFRFQAFRDWQYLNQ